MKAKLAKCRLLLLLITLIPLSAHTQIPCNAHFTWHALSSPNTIQFNSLPSTVNATYSWSFGDGTASSVPNPHHTFAPGVYNVCLTVTVSGANGTVLCTASYCDSVQIPAQNCNANFTHSQSPVNTGVHFTPASNPPGTIYNWSFGDGDSSTLVSPNHIYAPGNYQVCLTVTSISPATGITCTQTWCDSIQVGNASFCNAHFNFQPIPGSNAFQFNSMNNPPNTQYLWNFGDGSSSTQANPHHSFLPGNYSVCLTVTTLSSSGVPCTHTWCDSLHVPQAPLCNAHFMHQTGAAPNIIHFNSVNLPHATYAWDFGDGSTSTNPDPHHIFAPGSYNVCLTVTIASSAGTALCTATWCDTIHINAVGNCYSNFVYHHLPAPFTYGFHNLSSPNATGYFWHFGDGTVSMQQNPVHQYAGPGHYQVCVTMIDTINHCSKTRCRILSSNAIAASGAQNVLRPNSMAEDGALAVDVYPNPASDHLNVLVQNAGSDMDFMLFDSTGKNVLKEKVSESHFLDIGHLTTGIYYYRINSASQAGLNGKIMIQR